MAKKSGLFTLLLGATAGAVAVLLSDKSNRRKAELGLQKVGTKAKHLAHDLEANPEKVARRVVTRSKKVAAVATGQATVATKKARPTRRPAKKR